MQYIIFLLLLAQATLVPRGSYAFTSWQIAFFILPIIVSYFIKNKFGKLAGLTCFWVLFSGGSIVGDQGAWAWVPELMGVYSNQAVLYSLTLVLFFIFIFSHFKLIHYHAIEKSLGLICIINSIATLLTSHENAGFFSNESINGVTIAVTYPFLNLKHYKTPPYLNNFSMYSLPFFIIDFICVVTPIIAIFSGSATIPMATMLIVIYLTLGFAFKKQILKITPLILILCLAVAKLYPEYLDSSGRYSIWIAGLNWWASWVPKFNGMGIGTTWEFLPYIQKTNGFDMAQVFVWFHNEFLQVLFEQGFIGLILWVSLFFKCLYHSRKKDYLFISLVAFGFSSFFNFTMHLPFQAFIGSFLIARSLYGRN